MTKEQIEILEKIKADNSKQKALDYLIKSFPELNEDYILCEVANYEIDGFDYENQVVNRYIGYTDAVKELQEKITQLEKLLAEQHPDLKQSLERASQRENELVEENEKLKKEYSKIKALHAKKFDDEWKLNGLYQKLLVENANVTDAYWQAVGKIIDAKEIIKEFFRITTVIDDDFEHDYSQLIEKAEAFIKE